MVGSESESIFYRVKIIHNTGFSETPDLALPFAIVLDKLFPARVGVGQLLQGHDILLARFTQGCQLTKAPLKSHLIEVHGRIVQCTLYIYVYFHCFI